MSANCLTFSRFPAFSRRFPTFGKRKRGVLRALFANWSVYIGFNFVGFLPFPISKVQREATPPRSRSRSRSHTCGGWRGVVSLCTLKSGKRDMYIKKIIDIIRVLGKIRPFRASVRFPKTWEKEGKTWENGKTGENDHKRGGEGAGSPVPGCAGVGSRGRSSTSTAAGASSIPPPVSGRSRICPAPPGYGCVPLIVSGGVSAQPPYRTL